MERNIFHSISDTEPTDETLVSGAAQGDTGALDTLVRRHQPWIFNLAIRMVWRREAAEDATQEILIKAVTNLGGFRGESKFRTWLYRIAVNHLLNVRETEVERKKETFADYGRILAQTPELELADPNAPAVDQSLLVEEARQGCMLGMLLCLDRRQRLAFILGEIFGVSSEVGGEVLTESPENFRQLLSRARRDLYQFMQEKCGLVNTANPCRCAKKTRAFIQAGYVDPKNMNFTRERQALVEQVASSRINELLGMERQHAALFRTHPFFTPPDVAGRLRELIKPFAAPVDPGATRTTLRDDRA